MNKRQLLMSGLIMPSFLGACWVWFVQAVVATWESGFTWIRVMPLCYAAVFLLYYMIPYLILVKTTAKYEWKIFLINLGDSTVMVMAFYFLGLVEPLEGVNYQNITFCGLLMALLAILYRKVGPNVKDRHVIEQVVFVLMALLPLLFGQHEMAFRAYLVVLIPLMLIYVYRALR